MLLIFCSCNRLDGKIDPRDKNKVYLVNESITKTFKFTLKTISITNDSIYNYQTKIIELAPGDEVFIGNKYEVSKPEYPLINVPIFVTHPIDLNLNEDGLPIRKSKSSSFSSAFYESIKERDTVINGKSLKYSYSTIQMNDSLHPYPIKHYKYKYEVTGQVEIETKK